MVIEFSSKNMEKIAGPADFRISRANDNIEIVVANSYQSSIILSTRFGDFISCDTTFIKDGLLKLSLYKLSDNFARTPLDGIFYLRAKSVMHRKEETKEFIVDITP